jgi:acetyl esterase/lipase
VYGCSAGAMLTAQSVAWFLDKSLPVPGAIGMFCMGAPTSHDFHSDGGVMSDALTRRNMTVWYEQNQYFKHVKRTDILAYPGISLKTLIQFPQSLLIIANRDFCLSSVVSTHTKLRKLGVEADLFVWEGLDHGFHLFSTFSESREAYNIIVDFFDKQLGKKHTGITNEKR